MSEIEKVIAELESIVQSPEFAEKQSTKPKQAKHDAYVSGFQSAIDHVKRIAIDHKQTTR